MPPNFSPSSLIDITIFDFHSRPNTPNFSASSLIDITILDFHSRPSTNCSEFRLSNTQLYKVFQSNVSISLDLCICHHKMLSNQFFFHKTKMLNAPKLFCFITNEYNNFGFSIWAQYYKLLII